MKTIKPNVEKIVFHLPEGYKEPIDFLEEVGRVCYESNDKIKENSAEKFIKNIVKRGHHSIIEHCTISAFLEVDRGVSHEMVRHRLASFAQESSRYCNYSKKKFNNEITVVEYPWKNEISKHIHDEASIAAEEYYFKLLENGEPPELARAVLPISLRTKLVVTANLREWLTIFKLRTDSAAHPMIREISKELLVAFHKRFKVIYQKQVDSISPYVKCAFCGTKFKEELLGLGTNAICPICHVDFRESKE